MSIKCKIPPAGWTCSRIQYHSGPCAASPEECATNLTAQSITEILAEEDRRTQERYDCICIHCGKQLVNYHMRARILHHPKHSYDEENKTGFHISCQTQYESWFKDWLNMWAQIGWHAKFDIMALRPDIWLR